MRIYDIAFYAAGFFLVGVFLASSGLSLFFILALASLLAVTIVFCSFLKRSRKLIWAGGLSLMIVIGSAYLYFYRAGQAQDVKIVFDRKIDVHGIIVREPERGTGQQFVLDLAPPHSGKILVRERLYPQFFYGDTIHLKGVIQEPQPEGYAHYLAKDGVVGISVFPKTEKVAGGGGSIIRRALFATKGKTIAVFNRILPAEEAAFLAGLTLGERSGFSKELIESLKASGTTHLVALSGYNITLIVVAIRRSLGRMLSRQSAFFLTLGLISLFVVMTGAEASVVRAAIMGAILLLAQEIGRPSSFRNAITLTAFGMALINPLIVRFDVGFQLSFLSLLGITYLAPITKKMLRLKDAPGSFEWRENLVATIGAQLAVVPLLILYFGTLSLTFLPANILVLGLVPWTMTLGFAVGVLGFFSLFLAQALGWFLHLLLAYELFVIRFFGQFSPWNFDSIKLPAVFLYYSILLFFVVIYSRRTKGGIMPYTTRL